MKAFFLSRQFREKILLVGLALCAAGIWLSAAGKRAGRVWREAKTTSIDLREQEMTLAQKDAIKARSQAAIERLDPTRTFNPVQLQAEVNTIAHVAGLGTRTNISSSPTERSNQFAIHSVQVAINNAEYGSLVKFYMDLQKRAPYIGIEQFDLRSTSPNSPTLRQTLRVSSFDFARDNALPQ